MSYIGQQLGYGRQEKYTFTAAGGETSIHVADDGRNILYDPNFVDVFINGVKIIPGVDFSATTGNSITFTETLDNEDIVEVVGFEIASLIPSYNQATIAKYTYVASGGETSVTETESGFPFSYTPNYVAVFKNGVKLVENSDFFALDGSTITNLSALNENDVIEIISMPVVEVVDALPTSGGVITGDLTVTGTFFANVVGQELDGGLANSTYLSVQLFDGGDANG